MPNSYVVTSIDCDAADVRILGTQNLTSAVDFYAEEVLRGCEEKENSNGMHVGFVSLESFDEKGNPQNQINTGSALECPHTRMWDDRLASAQQSRS